MAQGLLADFTVHTSVVDESEVAALIAEWTDRVAYRLRHAPPPVEDFPELDPDHP